MSTKEIAYGMSNKQLSDFAAPFGKSAEIPNSETLEAIREVKDMKLHPENYKSYDDADIMFKELLA